MCDERCLLFSCVIKLTLLVTEHEVHSRELPCSTQCVEGGVDSGKGERVLFRDFVDTVIVDAEPFSSITFAYLYDKGGLGAFGLPDKYSLKHIINVVLLCSVLRFWKAIGTKAGWGRVTCTSTVYLMMPVRLSSSEKTSLYWPILLQKCR